MSVKKLNLLSSIYPIKAAQIPVKRNYPTGKKKGYRWMKKERRKKKEKLLRRVDART